MSLYTPANGLFGTHVTWEDIKEVMQKELNTNSSFGSNKTATNIGEGKGFMSRIVLIEPDWQNKDKKLPERFIAKLLTMLAMQQLTEGLANMSKGVEDKFSTEQFVLAYEDRLKKLHNSEVVLYGHLMKLSEGKFPTPHIYHAKKFSESNPLKGYILMEYKEKAETLTMLQNVSLENIKEVLRAVAVMEAMSLKFTPEEKKEFREQHFTWGFQNVLSKDVLSAMVKAPQMFNMAVNAEKLEKYPPDIMNLAWADQLSDELGMQRVICHGDLWSANILWNKKESGELTLSALVDFQTAHLGCPAGDLTRLFGSCLSGKDRREHWEELLESFYSYLQEEVVENEMPYTLEQLKESYRRFLPFGGFLVLPMFGALLEMVSKSPDEEFKNQCLATALEKIACMVEDVVEYHERNLKLKSDIPDEHIICSKN
ncbi:unnamed protein product [Cylicocyclus nassatus]|uniref:CHK kinase-like domain-containing protein n=1 Tax=Cylicocyclus nassatus TaxID=53992 RepID=A0AA36DL83_CYLNA|nr:unnamed protein product [Cylicocyclus nassatus]